MYCPNCGFINYSYNKSICDECGYKFSGKNFSGKEETIDLSGKEEAIDLLSFQDEIKKLNNTIADLRRKGKKAVASRDSWKRKAEDAEKKIVELEKRFSRFENGFTNSDSKFQKIKNRFAVMYHPDKIIGDKYEKLIKQEIFKEFWEEIEKIDNK